MEAVRNMTTRIHKALNRIGNQISSYRKRNHITQVQLAKASKIPQASIARIEHGENTSVLTLAKIAVVMNQNIGLEVTK